MVLLSFSYYFLFFSSDVVVYDFDGGTGPILLDEVQCTGSESSLSQCPHAGIKNHDCFHSEDAGVRCLSGKGPWQEKCMYNAT